MSGGIILSRNAGEEGDPAKLGKVRGSRLQTNMPASPHLPVACRNGALLLPLKKREKTCSGR